MRSGATPAGRAPFGLELPTNGTVARGPIFGSVPVIRLPPGQPGSQGAGRVRDYETSTDGAGRAVSR